MPSTAEGELETYVDSSWANGPDRKSMYGYLITFVGKLLHYKTKKQNTIALSSTEAEFYALSQASKDTLWLQNILQELKVKVTKTGLYCDNQAAIRIAQSEESSS